jgi:N-acetylneuraminic acid mutarotase
VVDNKKRTSIKPTVENKKRTVKDIPVGNKKQYQKRVYTSLIDKWTQVDNIPLRRSLHSTTVVRGHIYIIDGHRTMGRTFILVWKDVDHFNPVTEEWISYNVVCQLLRGGCSSLTMLCVNY